MPIQIFESHIPIRWDKFWRQSDPIRYEGKELPFETPTPLRKIQSNQLKKGGLYKSASGFQVRCLGRSPEGSPILLQYHKGDLTRELGVYMVTSNTFSFEVIHETPEDEDADQDF